MSEHEFEGPRDRGRIDVGSDDEIRWWADQLGVTNVAIIDAVTAVGPRADDVRRHLDQAVAAEQADG